MIRYQFKTRDDVTLNAVETGNRLGQAILFVHGLSQSWRSWMPQFADPELRERFHLVALDLRGHGESQGACGAVDQEGNPLAALADAQYNDGNVETTSRSWAYDLDATIEALHLDHPVLIGWSAGAWAVQSYFLAHSGTWRHRQGDPLCLGASASALGNRRWRESLLRSSGDDRRAPENLSRQSCVRTPVF
jgi:pimeloyl-ACP methyl ester carboxylesterase